MGTNMRVVYRLITMRSNDQFNTTIYGYSDRLRGIEGTRDVLLMSPEEIRAAGLSEGQVVSLVSDADDGVHREWWLPRSACPAAAWVPTIPRPIRWCRCGTMTSFPRPRHRRPCRCESSLEAQPSLSCWSAKTWG